jgi:hypothetical protein
MMESRGRAAGVIRKKTAYIILMGISESSGKIQEKTHKKQQARLQF